MIILEQWVEYDDRTDWYLDSDLIITLNKDGFENSLAWRTRLVDYVWSGVPVGTNGGDPLGEDLIRNGAAFRIDISTPDALAQSIIAIIENKSNITNVRQAMSNYRPKLFHENALRELASHLKN